MKVGMRKTNYKRRVKNQLWKNTVGVTPATAKGRVKNKLTHCTVLKLVGV